MFTIYVTCAVVLIPDFGLESGDLVGGEFARVALVLEGAESVQSFVAIDPEPFAQSGKARPQEFGDFFPSRAPGDSQDGGEALIDTPIEGFLASPLDLLALLISQVDRFHGRMPSLLRRHETSSKFNSSGVLDTRV